MNALKNAVNQFLNQHFKLHKKIKYLILLYNMLKNKQMLMYGNQMKYLAQLKRELQARKSKVANISYRKKLRENQNRENYLTELHRIRGVLSQNENRLPIGTRERLTQRSEELKKLIKNNAFPSDYNQLIKLLF